MHIVIIPFGSRISQITLEFAFAYILHNEKNGLLICTTTKESNNIGMRFQHFHYLKLRDKIGFFLLVCVFFQGFHGDYRRTVIFAWKKGIRLFLMYTNMEIMENEQAFIFWFRQVANVLQIIYRILCQLTYHMYVTKTMVGQ